MSNSAWDRIRALLDEQNLPHHGFARLEKPASFALYQAWLEKDYAGEMDYLHRHVPLKEDPSKLMAQARSAIVVTFDYVPHPSPQPDFPLKEAKVALYARGEDYHFWIKRKLSDLIERLKLEFPEESFACFTDSAPVLERDLAKKAGLGWVGKNTCLIHPRRGSLFLIGEIYTTLTFDSEPAAAIPDFCGTCTRCIDICPTDAIVAPRELDARKCISYLTIESKTTPPPELREKLDGWLFGCDLCQTVCPWNVKLHGKTPGELPPIATAEERRARLIEELRMILTSSNSRLLKLFRGSPLVRAGGVGLKRNALLVCAHIGARELLPEIGQLKSNEKLEDVAVWAEEQVTGTLS